MAAAEQNGIDILCDAAGSDMLLSSLFALAAPGQDQQRAQPQDQHELQHPLPAASATKQPHQQQVYHQQLDPALQPSQQETLRKTTSSLPAKRKLSDASASSPSHVCHICRRVYERADHLTRHLRSHENARPYQCSRCPKRFNRADLLTRHETTHDRDGAAKDRPFIRRNDRAAEACLNCAASKAKCEDQKPCSRCRNKNLTCQMPARRGNQYRTSESQAGVSPSDSSMVASTTGNDNQVFTAGDAAYALSQSAVAHQVQSIDSNAGYAGSSFLGAPSVEATPDETLYFAAPRKLLPDIELSWGMDFGGFTVPTSHVNGPSPQLENGTKRSSRQPRRDMAQEDAAPKLSAWVADPDTNGEANASAVSSKKVLPIIRDGLFAMVLAHNSNSPQVPTFPSAETLSNLLEAFFAQQDQRQDAFIHKASFNTSAALLELVSAVISSGAAHISALTAWQFGLALDEVLGTALNSRLESFAATTKPLMLLQASMLHLDIGQWCGSSRQMEMAQTFAQQVLTLVRGTGRISFSSDSTLYTPSTGDAPEALESKWQYFATIESYKRLMMRLFIHGVQSSIVSWRSSNMSYNELDFTLPAASDLWKAASSQQWRELYSTKRSTTAGIPRLLDVGDCMSFITEPNDHVDIELCCTAALSGLWGQIWMYRDAVTYHSNPDQRSTGSPAWTKALYQDLYSRLASFSNAAQGMQTLSPKLLLFCELLMMTLHVSFDELHRLAGYNGEGGSRRAAQVLEAIWYSGPESRHAVWHAGQVLRYAQDCKATSLQGFNSMAVYFAGLTLWAYGIMSTTGSTNGQGTADDHVLLNGQETRESRAFLELGQGTPALALPAGLRLQIEPLSNHDVALSFAQNVLRQNFPVLSEPLPQLVENLWRRLAELQSGQNGQAMTNTDGTVSGDGPLHDELIFERLDDARILRHYENNAKTWAAPLSTTDFLDIHYRLGTIPGEARSFEIWALRRPDDPWGIISSCATHIRDAIVSRGKGVRMAGTVIISEIFTDPEHRTRGFAKLLLKRVQEHFDKRDDLGIDFTIIYGNGSLTWYRELGWKPLTATQLTINVERFQTCAECHDVWEYLTLEEITNIAACDVNVSKLRLSKAQGPKTHIQLLPTEFLTRRHLYRSACLAYKLRQGHPYTRHHGVSILEEDAEVSAWWVHDFQNRRLMIGRLFLTRLGNVDELVVEVLEAAMEEAARRGLREVVLWDPNPQVVVAAMTIWDKYDTDVQVTTEERKEMVPCVRWKGGEERDVVLEEGHFVSWS